jgi:hypothetical protein
MVFKLAQKNKVLLGANLMIIHVSLFSIKYIVSEKYYIYINTLLWH